MANKRELKQTINFVCAELLSETFIAGMLEKNIENGNVDNLLHSIIRINQEYISRISHPEPGMPAKVYFKNLIEGFDKDVDETIDMIGNLY
ncbi:MAG: hypothetical protein HUK07_05270 [Bacteroidaceae bacterium]|nr:hypothetical protein [Bacteroidaceae bacterium]